LPSVGSPITPPVPGDADGLGAGEPPGPGEALPSGEGLATGALAPGEALAAGDPPAFGDALAAGEALAPGDALAPGEAAGDGAGCSVRPIWTVRIRRYSRSPAVVTATVPGSSCSSMIERTSAGSGRVFAKWISHTVPPVKSIENLRPPPNGVSRMKIRPGIVISALKM
jgi:hypothetical protein